MGARAFSQLVFLLTTRYLKPCGRVALLIILSYPFSVSANDEDYLELNLEELLQVTIKGSTLREESIKTVPSSVTVFTHEQLEALGLDYLHELMNLVPGFQTTRVADTSFGYTFSARGRRLGARAREILLLVDGRVFFDPRSGGADSALTLFPLANIERIEIIRGPGSTIYGSGAFTGVINIVSRRNQNILAVATGSDDQRKADVNLAQTLGDVQVNVYAHAYQDNGQFYRLASGATTRDPRQEALIDLELRYKNTRVQFFDSRLEGEDFYSLEKIDNDFNQSKQLFRHLRIEQTLNPQENWNTTFSLNYFKATQDLDGVLVPANGLLAISQPASAEPMLGKVLLTGEAYRADLANDVSLSKASSVQFGAEWRHERETDAQARTNYNLDQLVGHDFPVTYFNNFDHSFSVGAEESRDIAGIYSQLLHSFTSDTRLTIGARYDYYQSTDGHLSPRISLVHQLNEYQTLKLLYGEAFRTPSFAETSLLNNPVLVGNPNLDNETVKTLELLWMGNWNSVTISSILYHSRYVNPISTGLLGTTRTYVNGPDESQYGMGVRMDWKITPQWLFRISHSRMEDLPDSAFREADKLATVTVNYHQDKWNWNLSANYQNEREYLITQNQRATLDPHWTANTKLAYRLAKTTTISFAAKNLTNEDYASPTQGTGIEGGIPNRGREWKTGVEWGF